MRLISAMLLAGLVAGPAVLLPAHDRAPASAPVANIRYEITFNRETAARRSLGVTMRFEVAGPGDVLLSLPVWTPGAYEVSNFARWVSNFRAAAGETPLTWDKLDYDTWRIRPAGARQITVRFDYQADTLDNAMAWSRPDFCFFNGTNVLLYPEGRSLAFPASVTVETEPDWLVVTGMRPATGPRTFSERHYDDLVDMPFFVGRLDLDSLQVGRTWQRLATYPAGVLSGPARAELWEAIAKLVPPEVAVFGEAPWATYTTMIVFDSAFGGGSALEHQNSHLGIYTAFGIGQSWIPSITAHEMFHSWNVKRLRPADLWPYRYDRPQPTPWLWVSEGITDYYADLALVRGGIVDSAEFFRITTEKITQVAETPPVALEDASLSTWIHPTDGTGYIYYPKGSLAGFMLDILIRDASDNRNSLDTVLRTLYQQAYRQGRGFTGAEWWAAVSRAASGRSFRDFNARYIDGREPFPWDSVLPLAGLRLVTDTVWEPRLHLQTVGDSAGLIVTEVSPGGTADQAGVKPGDVLIALGDIPVKGEESFARFRATYAGRDGAEFTIRVRRGGRELALPARVRLAARTESRIEADPAAPAKAARIRHGILVGSDGG